MAAPEAVIPAVKAAVKALYDKDERKKLFQKLGGLIGGGIMLVVMILCCFLLLIGGIFGLLVNTYVKENWNIVRNNIWDVFESLDRTANGEIRQAVYAFMPEFSVNLSKAAISDSYPGSLLIYDTAEYEKAREAMELAAKQLRSVNSEGECIGICSIYGVDYAEGMYEYIRSDGVFYKDTGIESAGDYSMPVRMILTAAAQKKLNNYRYTIKEYETEDGKKVKTQTLTVSGERLTEIVQYNTVGNVELYLPYFLALYQTRLCEDVFNKEISDEDGERFNQAIEENLGGDIGESENEEELQEAVKGMSNSDINSVLSFMQIADLKHILQKNLIEGGITADISYENGTAPDGNPKRKMIITLEAPDDEEWLEVFDIEPTDFNESTVEEFKTVISQILTDADISESEFYLNLDDFFQNALFIYFQGFFNLPVESTELVKLSNSIIDKYGDYSRFHTMGYNYAKTVETGVTIAVENEETEVKVDLLPGVKRDCIEDIVIYDIWLSGEHGNGEYGNRAIQSVSYGCNMITLAYAINTERFEQDYGFSFPSPFEQYDEEMNTEITMLVEYSCLSECYYPTISYQVGDSVKEQIEKGNFSIGLCNNGITNSSEQNAASEYDWHRHNGNTPHLSIKVAFFNYAGIDLYDTNTNTYSGITGSNYKNYWYMSNPMLWFKGFRTEVEDEALAGLVAM